MILLGFDIEEFDMPLDYGFPIPFRQQLSVSTAGTLVILDILKDANIKATFYCTAIYATNQPGIIQQIVREGHEVASHGYYHNYFEPEHLRWSKQVLENISCTEVLGYRMARMMPVEETATRNAGYVYNSSVNPTWLPGRYNHLNKPRAWFFDQNLLQLPVSVSPLFRFPLFWLSFHHLPIFLIKWLCAWTHDNDGYLHLYFHPWEFTNLNVYGRQFGLPAYICKNTGESFRERMEGFICWAQSCGHTFVRTDDFVRVIHPAAFETTHI
ncbi:MAG: polysaccharide deacetylase family protein [Mucilaginibacter sp.]